jgi:hypothetical protein
LGISTFTQGGHTALGVSINNNKPLIFNGSNGITVNNPSSDTIEIGINENGITARELAPSSVGSSEITDNAITNEKLDKGNIPLSGFGIPNQNISMGNNRITDLATPFSNNDATNKRYVDSIMNIGINNINLNNGHILMGDALNKAVDTTLGNGQILIGTLSGQTSMVDVTGDISINSSGVTTITDGAVNNIKIANGAVDNTKLADNSVNSDKIEDGSIVENDIADRAITKAKLDTSNIPVSVFAEATDTLKMGNKRITNVANPIKNTDAATKAYVDSKVSQDIVLNGSITANIVYLGDSTTIGTWRIRVVNGDLTFETLETLGPPKQWQVKFKMKQ